MIIPIILFYVFSFITVASALAVIVSKNPVHSVFFLILAFFNSAGLFILLGAELLAMILVIVYVGAVAVLFLFVVMMLNVNIARIKEGFTKHLPIGLVVAVLLFVELFFVIKASSEGFVINVAKSSVTNAEAIGMVLYTDYAFVFQIAGLILLVAMIGAIVLTHRQREGVKRQNIGKQLSRTREQSIEIIKIDSGKGA